MTKGPAAALALLLTVPSSAAELAGVGFPERAESHGRDLVLNGLGLREATMLRVDVYVAGLYLPAPSDDPAAIVKADLPKRIVLHFMRSVGKEKLAEAWTEGFAANAGEARSVVAPGLAALNAAMADVKKDDVLALDYEPGAGVGVAFNGHAAATIPGEEFQRVLFSIWLGPKPPNIPLREGLLGRSGKGGEKP